MKKSILVLMIIGSAVLTLLLCATVLLFMSDIDIAFSDNENTVEVFKGKEIPKPNAELVFYDIKIPLSVTLEGEVDFNKTGEYPITFKAGFLFKTAKEVQNISVKDTVAPVIEPSDYNVTFNHKGRAPTVNDIKIGYKATDNYDGDLTAKVTKEIVGKTCILSVTDSSGNVGRAEISIIVNDGASPTINLTGGTAVYHLAGRSYSEAGYSAIDNIDGDLTGIVKVSGKVDANKSGVYPITYTVADSSGNETKVTRKVIVYGTLTAADFSGIAPNGKTVYLTFDDGPGPYTETLLGYLRQYNIKATFFVTNQFPKYQSLIGKAHLDGHKIAVHTQTHQWSVYSSVDSYMADFNNMQEIVKAQTGSYTDIFRFPGGTNNTVSRRYKRGIMSVLANKMTADGYTYFDWNCDCNDARHNDTASVICDTLTQISTKQNAVVLMHDIKSYTVDAVPAVIEECLRNGYTFKVLDKNSPSVRFKPAN